MSHTELSDADLLPYGALTTGAVVIRRPDLHHLSFTGPKAGDVLTGLVTNHVLALAEGAGQYAAALTAKGKIVADLRIVRTGAEAYLTTTRTPSWPGWRDLVRKYVNPRLARYVEEPLETVSVFGPAGRAAVSRALVAMGAVPVANELEPDNTTPEYMLTRYVLDDVLIMRISNPELGSVPGEDLVVLPAQVESLLARLTAEPGVAVGSEALLEVARIEAGRPRWGQDMDDSTIPQEANLGELGALSFEKGCYTGQETVARVHFRGHVNRHLRRLRSDRPLPVGADVRTAEGKAVGDVRSSAVSPRAGAVAIAMLRREVEPGSVVQIIHGDSDVGEATVER